MFWKYFIVILAENAINRFPNIPSQFVTYSGKIWNWEKYFEVEMVYNKIINFITELLRTKRKLDRSRINYVAWNVNNPIKNYVKWVVHTKWNISVQVASYMWITISHYGKGRSLKIPSSTFSLQTSLTHGIVQFLLYSRNWIDRINSVTEFPNSVNVETEIKNILLKPSVISSCCRNY